MTNSRRSFLRSSAQIGALAPFLTLGAAMQRASAQDAANPPAYPFGDSAEEAYQIAYRAHEDVMAYPDLHMHGNETIVMLAYPKMTMLDLVGPQYFFASMMGAKVHLVTKDPELTPIMGDTGFAIIPTVSMADCPSNIDILFVPGGTGGTVSAMLDDETIDFVADRASRAKHVTSVCTGSLILGQAGLLKGKRATSHWATRHLLTEFGATPVDARVVSDGNLMTGAGVSAGLDFALSLLAQIRGKAYAQAIQLQAEYAPEPLFTGGTPATTDPRLRDPLHKMFATAIFAMKEATTHQRK
ncbi:MAG: DJ-1/PfpI family protein [Pseudomonadota bacterium]